LIHFNTNFADVNLQLSLRKLQL